ncbi:nucleotide sugar dehydrogenase [Chloroflexota bacterium]
MKLKDTVVCVIGLGYVGLPLAKAFSKKLKVIGYDNDEDKLRELTITNSNQNLYLTSNAEKIGEADFIIICVPTPVTESKEPDLSYVENAAMTVGQNIKRGSTVILESTVYPGTTDEIVKPILEKESGFSFGNDIKIGYSPERINPGDEEHSIDRVTKVVAGMDEGTTESLAELYKAITPYIFRANDIKTAEAAKIIENIQRDLNIALMNELSIIFEKMGLNTREVLEAAGTKWNFHHYSPGLVGGHCIPVDPYYLVDKAKELGYDPQVILAGRAINDSMPQHVAQMTVKALNLVGKETKGARVLIMGLTYKENVADTRETPVIGIIAELKGNGVEIWGYDPLVTNIKEEFGIDEDKELLGSDSYDAVIVTVGHDVIKGMTLYQINGIMNNNPLLVDVRGIFSAKEAAENGLIYITL